ncbi:DinB family protein [Mesobacillus zeae]|uniref:DinB family protein n=1 Tax=Mesobacillus zeae TaxID=1917180 RepID=A0A398BJ01_9BACI|nr:DinB family protein [Mesobacillus zeae]RID88548.1 DinB family protein [Mesobacillus zeae]
MYKNKKQIINHYEESIDWVKILTNLSEEKWRTQIDKGKWTIAEIIGHLIPWDEFVLNQRIPYLLKATQLPNSLNAEFINHQASIDSKSRPKDETIKLFIAVRKKLINTLNDLSDELWTQDFIIGKDNIALFSYFAGLVEHDEHHFRQIQRVL